MSWRVGGWGEGKESRGCAPEEVAGLAVRRGVSLERILAGVVEGQQQPVQPVHRHLAPTRAASTRPPTVPLGLQDTHSRARAHFQCLKMAAVRDRCARADRNRADGSDLKRGRVPSGLQETHRHRRTDTDTKNGRERELAAQQSAKKGWGAACVHCLDALRSTADYAELGSEASGWGRLHCSPIQLLGSWGLAQPWILG